MRKLHDIFARASDPVFAIDGARRVVYQNNAFTGILARPQAATAGRCCYEVVRGVCSRAGQEGMCSSDCTVGATLLQDRPVDAFGLTVPRRDGQALLFNVCAFPVNGTKTLAAVFIMRPVSMTSDAVSPPRAVIQDSDDPAPQLTLRERQILRMLANDVSIRSLAASLSISYVTARNHIRNIFAKLGVHNRAAAIGLAFRHNLL